jgi:NTP pyrophosphatase (non-canonical NTP hydrolase)
MNFSEYQELARETAIYPNLGGNIYYPVLGLCGESGEVAEKVKKILRDDNGIVSEIKRQEIKKELGDVLWYIANIGCEFGIKLEDIAESNIQKLHDRQKVNTLHGSGDNR